MIFYLQMHEFAHDIMGRKSSKYNTRSTLTRVINVDGVPGTNPRVSNFSEYVFEKLTCEFPSLSGVEFTVMHVIFIVSADEGA